MSKHFKTISDLLNAYFDHYFPERKKRSDKAKYLQQKLELPTDRTVKRWLSGETIPSDSNLEEIARITKIPRGALYLLKTGVEIDFNFQNLRYSERGIKHPNHLSQDRLNFEHIPEPEQRTNYSLLPITKSKHVTLIKDYDNQVYSSRNTLSDQTLARAAAIIPKLNFIFLDNKQKYNGHWTCIPLSKQTYLQLRNQEIEEIDIVPADLSNILAFKEGVLYFWSMYGPTNETLLKIIYEVGEYLSTISKKNNIRVATYSITAIGHELCRKIGLETILENHEDPCANNTEVTPTLFEGSLNEVVERASQPNMN